MKYRRIFLLIHSNPIKFLSYLKIFSSIHLIAPTQFPTPLPFLSPSLHQISLSLTLLPLVPLVAFFAPQYPFAQLHYLSSTPFPFLHPIALSHSFTQPYYSFVTLLTLFVPYKKQIFLLSNHFH